jgi:FtsP/CotA-like multicopper oxidase with cupredoxin domain
MTADLSRRRFVKWLLGGAIAAAMPMKWTPATARAMGDLLRQPKQIASRHGVTEARLTVKYTDPGVTRIGPYPVRVRSFNGEIPAPTLRVKQGERLKIRLRNRLPPNPNIVRQDHAASAGHDAPHHFNTTNIHTHGLHVSPQPGSDYVFLKLLPADSPIDATPDTYRESYDYTYDIRSDHPTGTFLYHPHSHGSTAIQVASGMAGALIVDPSDPKDVPDELRSIRDVVFLIQQVPFSLKGKIGVVEEFSELSPADYPFVTINGQWMPRILVSQGEVFRLRMLNAHYRSAIRIGVAEHAMHHIATDGIYFDAMRSVGDVSLAPGNRQDVLLKAVTKPGIYPIVSLDYDIVSEYHFAGRPPEIAIGQCPRVPAGRILAFLEVTDTARDMKLPEALPRPTGLPDLSAKPYDGSRSFRLAVEGGHHTVNGKSFSPDNAPEVIRLGNHEKWEMFAEGGCHPFHVHVNPFQVLQINGQDLDRPLWKDTVMIPNGGKVICRIQFSDFDGPSLIHCHRLEHEDFGMMLKMQLIK